MGSHRCNVGSRERGEVGSLRCNAGSRERVVRWVAIDVMLAVVVRWVAIDVMLEAERDW